MPTHGSLTKAGKVRGQTPKVEGRKIVGTNAKLRNKSNFRKRLVLTKLPGQNKASAKRRRRKQFFDILIYSEKQQSNTFIDKSTVPYRMADELELRLDSLAGVGPVTTRKLNDAGVHLSLIHI